MFWIFANFEAPLIFNKKKNDSILSNGHVCTWFFSHNFKSKTKNQPFQNLIVSVCFKIVTKIGENFDIRRLFPGGNTNARALDMNAAAEMASYAIDAIHKFQEVYEKIN